MFSQKGKGQEKNKFDRGAEKQVYGALEEHLAAHEWRYGTPETDYFQNSRFTKSKLRRMGYHSMIKSLETVRN